VPVIERAQYPAFRRTNQFRLTAPGANPGDVLGFDESLNLGGPEDGDAQQRSAVFTDDTATNFPARFYRVRVP